MTGQLPTDGLEPTPAGELQQPLPVEETLELEPAQPLETEELPEEPADEQPVSPTAEAFEASWTPTTWRFPSQR